MSTITATPYLCRYIQPSAKMVLFENSIIRLDYQPATDILEVGYPDLHGYLLPEIKYSIDILIDAVKNYDVKKVLLDSSKTVISVSPEESREISVYLATGLIKTRLQKLARVQSLNFDVETRAKASIRHISVMQLLSFQLHNFPDKEEALKWLARSED